jgi:hypothetical protein
MIRRVLSTGTLLLAIAQGVISGGCANNGSTPQERRAVVDAYRLDADDQPTLLVDTAPTVMASSTDLDHFTRLLKEKLDARRMRNLGDGNARQCDVHITVTRFDGGTGLARAFLAGSGQLHVDASVLVTSAGGGDPLDKFEISKTFSWGGAYGASEGVRNFEPSLADGIAAALTGQPAEVDKVAVANREIWQS